MKVPSGKRGSRRWSGNSVAGLPRREAGEGVRGTPVVQAGTHLPKRSVDDTLHNCEAEERRKRHNPRELREVEKREQPIAFR